VQTVNSTEKYQNRYQGGGNQTETTERPGYFVGFADNVGDALTFKILKNELVTFYLEVW
jgi:hypothetical protein